MDLKGWKILNFSLRFKSVRFLFGNLCKPMSRLAR